METRGKPLSTAPPLEAKGGKEAPSRHRGPRESSDVDKSEEKNALPEEQRIKKVKCLVPRSLIPKAANIPGQQVLGASWLLPSFQNLLREPGAERPRVLSAALPHPQLRALASAQPQTRLPRRPRGSGSADRQLAATVQWLGKIKVFSVVHLIAWN
uniref:Uncharacterized protein n=1 Tax=Molossus molossus TaxID=27622 RepID=A0A7J8F966_MOLMO|nr:hypothetical protein HJG59_008519 [Molossus molossus]